MELQQDSVILRAFRHPDRKPMALLCNNRKIWNHVRDFIPSPYTEKDAVEFIENCCEENPQMTFVIELEQEFAGVIGLVLQPDVYRLSAELGYWLGEPYWGKGIAAKAVTLITEYAWKRLELIRIQACVFDFNKRSQRVLEKAGFKLEGIFKKAAVKNGVICDEYQYALLKG